MRLENCRKTEKLHAAKPKFKVTGVSFGGYGSQYDGKKNRTVTFGKELKSQGRIKAENTYDLPVDEKIDMTYPADMAYRIRQEANHYGHDVKTGQGNKYPAGNGQKVSGVVSGASFKKEETAEGYVRQTLKLPEEENREQKDTEETYSAAGSYEREYFAAVVLAGRKKREKSREKEDKKAKAESYLSKKGEEASENLDGNEKKEYVREQWSREKFSKVRVMEQQESRFSKARVMDQQETRFSKERALDKWKQEVAGGRYTGENLSREELARRCNVNSNRVADSFGVRSRAAMAEDYVSESEELEPWVCSEAEREKMRQKKADKKESSEGKEQDKKKQKTDKVKRTLLKRYIIREMIHEEGKQDPNAHFKLVGQFIAHDLGRLVAFALKLVVKLLLKIFLWLLPVILIAVLVILSLTAGYSYLLHPVSYYDNLYDSEEEIVGNPLYLKNVVQEKCRDFTGEMQTLEDNWRHEVSYPYGTYPDADIVTIVYLAQICTKGNYMDMTTDPESGYPPYLLVDTEEEQTLLDTVFSQFNYIESTHTIITILDQKNQPHPVAGFDTKIYCLTLRQWKQEYLDKLSADAEKLLEELEDKIGETGGTSGDFVGSEEAVPVEDLEIPDGVDENLIYMAGFIRAEAGNQPALGKTAVAYVILNRAGGPSGNIKGVLLAPYQFSCYIPYHTVEQYLTAYANMTQEQREADSCYQAAVGAYYGTAENPIGDMKYYCNPKYCSAGETKQWEKIRAKNDPEEIIIIGDHVFCKNCW